MQQSTERFGTRDCWRMYFRFFSNDCCGAGRLAVSLFFSSIGDTTEAEVVGAGGDFTFAAGADHVAGAILIGAEERTAAMDFLLVVGFGGIEGGVGALRIARDSAGLG